jgi:hypothetical protein
MKSFQRASTFSKGMLGSLKKSKDRNPETAAQAAANTNEPPETRARENLVSGTVARPNHMVKLRRADRDAESVYSVWR